VIAKSCSKGGCDEKYRMGEMLTSKREEKRHLGREYWNARYWQCLRACVCVWV